VKITQVLPLVNKSMAPKRLALKTYNDREIDEPLGKGCLIVQLLETKHSRSVGLAARTSM
jgi:hypothetical protein